MSHRRMETRWTSLGTVIVLVVVGCHSQREPSPPAEQPASITGAHTGSSSVKSPVAKAETAEPSHLPQLKEALKAYFQRSDNRDMERKLQEVYSHLPELKITIGNQPLQWNSREIASIKLQDDDEPILLDAFRFRSPLTVPADLHWVFGVPGRIGEWSILPVKGSTEGFLSEELRWNPYKRAWNIDIAEVSLPAGNTVILQELLGGKILPGEDYILWYQPEPFTTPPFRAALRLTPAGTHPPAKDRDDLARAVGLPLQHRTFPQTPAGVAAAYQVAAQVAKRPYPEPVAIGSVLQSVAPLLPELKLSTADGLAVWNRIRPDVSFQFHAVRFRSPFKTPADLHWCHAVEFDGMDFGVAVVDETFKSGADGRTEIDFPFSDASLPRRNQTTFHVVDEGKILPDRDYFIWFMPRRGALPEFDLALRLSPVGTFPKAVDSVSIAYAIGISFSAAPAPARLSAALHRCRQLVEEQRTESEEFGRLIRLVAPSLPVLPAESDENRWTSINVNQDGLEVAAFRLSLSQLAEVDVLAAIHRPTTEPVEWGYTYIGRDQVFSGIPWWKRSVKNTVSLIDPDQPPVNTVEVDDWYLNGTSKIETVVLLAVPKSKKPFTMHVAAKSLGSGRHSTIGTALAKLEKMGLGSNSTNSVNGAEDERRKVTALAAIRDDSYVAGSNDGRIWLWNPKAGKETKSAYLDQSGNGDYPTIGKIVVARSGRRLAAYLPHRDEFYVCDAETLAIERRLDVPFLGRSSMTFSPDGRYFCLADEGRRSQNKSSLRIWDLQSNDPPRVHEFPQDTLVLNAVWLADGKTIATAGWQEPPTKAGEAYTGRVGEIQFLDVSNFAVLKNWKELHCEWQIMALSADGSRLAVAEPTGLVTVYNTTSFNPVMSFVDESVQRISLSADAQQLLIFSNQKIAIWDVATRRLQFRLPKQSSAVSAALLSPDGETLVFGDVQGKLYGSPLSNLTPVFTAPLIENSIGQKLVPVAAGEFFMGTAPGTNVEGKVVEAAPQEGPVHRVRITRPYFLGQTEVTVAQFRKFVEATGYRTTAETSGKGGEHQFRLGENLRSDPSLNWKNPGFPQEDNHPVVQVSWHDATEFCKWLSGKEHLPYRLPTEAEWEYACRAGSNGSYSFASTNHLWRCANLMDRELQRAGGSKTLWPISDGAAYTAPVGSYVPNPMGLFDLHGNVFEWCSDWYDPAYYSYSPTDDPQGARPAKWRSQRSGGFLSRPGAVSAGSRDYGPPDQAQACLGFRVLREVP